MSNQVIFAVPEVFDPGTFYSFKSFTPAVVIIINWAKFGQAFTKAQLSCLTIQIYGIIPVVVLSGSGKNFDFTYGLNGLLIMLSEIFFGTFNTVYNASLNKKEATNYPIHAKNSIMYAFGFVINLSLYCASKAPGYKQLFYGYDNISVIMLLLLNSNAGITILMV